MEIVYRDYYKEYETEHNKAINALGLASNLLATKYLTKITDAMIEEANNCKIQGYNDNVVATYNRALEDVLKELENVSAFAKSYSSAEEAYVELKLELDALKQQNELFRSKYNSKPNINDAKYIMVIDGEDTVMTSRFYADKWTWEKECKTLDNNCIQLYESVESYIKYLTSINALNPKDGKIPSTLSKPTRIADLIYQISEDNEFYGPMPLHDSPYFLGGTELQQFLADNNIPNEPYISVLKSSIVVNGVPISTYKVYDTDCSVEQTQLFEKFSNGCTDYIAKIDPSVLSRIYSSDGPPAIVFEQTYRCDGDSLAGGEFNAAAYCNSNNRNVVQFCPTEEWRFDYSQRSIVHEIGHAYDFTLRYELTGERECGISHLDGSVDYPGSLKDENGNVISWKEIIRSDVNYFDEDHSEWPCIITFNSEEAAQEYYTNNCINATKSNITLEDGKWQLSIWYENSSSGVTVSGFGSVYNIHDYMGAYHEYFADAFEAYWIGDSVSDEDDTSRLEYLCPTTYNALNSLIEQDKQHYYSSGNDNQNHYGNGGR